MVQETDNYQYFDLEFLEGDMIYTAQGVKAKSLEHAKENVLCFLADVIS